MMGAVVTARSAHTAMVIPMMGYILAWIFLIYFNIFERKQMDVHRATEVGIVQPSDKQLELERNASEAETKPVTGTVEDHQ